AGRTLGAVAETHAVVAGQVGRGLSRGDDVIGRQGVFGVRQADLDDLGAAGLEPFHALVPEGLDLGGHAVDDVFLRHANAQTTYALAERLRPVRRLDVEAGRVLHVERTHRAQQNGGVLDRLR